MSDPRFGAYLTDNTGKRIWVTTPTAKRRFCFKSEKTARAAATFRLQRSNFTDKRVVVVQDPGKPEASS